MQFINIKDHKTGDTVKALNFGGPKCYKVSNRYVWAPEGGTSLVTNENSITLEPLGLVINNPNIWTIVSHQNVGTANWRITVKNLATGEEKAGVYPFNLNGNVYELECQPGTWVIASCGGYKIESSWEGQKSHELYRLKGTNEVINTYRLVGGYQIISYVINTGGLHFLTNIELFAAGFFELANITIISGHLSNNGYNMDVEGSQSYIYNQLALNRTLLGSDSMFIITNVFIYTHNNTRTIIIYHYKLY